ncbi:Uncharacterised protein [Candidatus Gugararchaeum adminiculabundum]|nr:Uncharacterised protein [Candidatus Gugararchaeum adminiculabundum]
MDYKPPSFLQLHFLKNDALTDSLMLGVKSLLILLIIAYTLVFLNNYLYFLGETYTNFNGLIWLSYDWPDTAFFTQIVQHGGFFTEQKQFFIAGGTMAGSFPPLFHILAAGLNLVANNITLTLVIMSILLSLLTAYFLLKDWPGWQFKYLLLLVLFFPPFQFPSFPIIMRLRELLAFLILTLMFKNPFKLSREAIFLIGGALLILSQPLVALFGIAAFFVLDHEKLSINLERKMLLPLAALAILFLLTYSTHTLAKFSGNESIQAGCTYGTIGCGANIIYEIYTLKPFLLFLVLTPLFLQFSPTKEIKNFWLAFLAFYSLLLLLTFFPEFFLKAISPIKEDLCLFLFPFIAFFALFPPKLKILDKRNELLLLLLLAMVLAVSAPIKERYDWDLKNSSDAALAVYKDNKTSLDVSLFFWDSTQKEYFESFDFRFMVQVAMQKHGNKMYYSPMQQFYDSDGMLPLVKNLLDSIVAKDLEKCSKARYELSKKIDYLHLQIELSDPSCLGWGRAQEMKLADKVFLEECGISLLFPNQITPLPCPSHAVLNISKDNLVFELQKSKPS